MAVKLTMLEHFRVFATTIKNFTNGMISQLATATTEAIEEINEQKANKDDVLTVTNKTSFIPTENYHPATKKYVDDSVNSANSHASCTMMSETGAHDLRYYDGKLQYYDNVNSTWVTLSIADLLI